VIVASRPRSTRQGTGSRTRRELADLQAWIHTLEPEWWTVATTFQRGPEWVTLAGVRWRVQFSFFGTRWGWTRNSHVRYSVNITLSHSDDLTVKERTALRRAGVYRAVARTVGEYGYLGRWHNRQTFGLFSKDLRTQDGVRQEVERFQGVSFKSLFGTRAAGQRADVRR
jgi:hypothetical protein